MSTKLIKPIAHQQISNNTVRNVTKFKYLTKIEKKKKNHQPIHPYKKFGIPWANFQNKTRIKIKFQKKKKPPPQD